MLPDVLLSIALFLSFLSLPSYRCYVLSLVCGTTLSCICPVATLIIRRQFVCMATICAYRSMVVSSRPSREQSMTAICKLSVVKILRTPITYLITASQWLWGSSQICVCELLLIPDRHLFWVHSIALSVYVGRKHLDHATLSQCTCIQCLFPVPSHKAFEWNFVLFLSALFLSCQARGCMCLRSSVHMTVLLSAYVSHTESLFLPPW